MNYLSNDIRNICYSFGGKSEMKFVPHIQN